VTKPNGELRLPITKENIMNKKLQEQLLIIIDHILKTEITHYEECGEPENHIYAIALEAKVALAAETM